jgi:hypothetical protein
MSARVVTPILEESPADDDDFLGQMYAELHRLGDDMGIRFARVAAAEAEAGIAEPQWVSLPHWRYDGVGAFRHLLRVRGTRDFVEPPGMPEDDRPSTVKKLRAMVQQLTRRRAATVWRLPVHLGTASERAKPLPEDATGWKVLDREATNALKDRARSLGVSLNSLLLWAAERTARHHWLAPSDQPSCWMVPVNLRDGVRLRRDTANHLGTLDVDLHPDCTVAEVHARVRGEIAAAGHWGSWMMSRLSGVLPRRSVAAEIRAMAEGPSIYTGLFSNLGRWSPPPGSTSADGEAAWLFAPQTIRMGPIALGAVTWADRLSLTLRAHPMFGLADAEVQLWVEAWCRTAIGAGGVTRGLQFRVISGQM